MTGQRSSLDFYEPVPVTALPLSKAVAPPEQPSLGDLWHAEVAVSSADLASAEQDRIHDAWAPVIDQLNRGRWWGMRYHNPGSSNTHPDIYLTDETGMPALDRPDTASLEDTAWGAVEARRSYDPDAFSWLPKTLDEFRDQILRDAKANIAEAKGVLARNQSWAGSGTEFLAGAVNGMRDPLIAASTIYMPFAGAGKTLMRRVLTTGLMNAGVAALEQPHIAASREKLGDTLTAGEAAENVIGAGVFAGGLHAAGETVIAPLARGVFGHGRALAARARSTIGEAMTDAERTAAAGLERDADVADTSPFTAGAGTDAHMAKMEQARQVLADPDAARVTADAPVPRETSPVPRFSFDNYAQRVGRVESGNDWTKTNPNSSAFGRWQITEGTFKGLWASEAEANSRWLNRNNPAVQWEAFRRLTAQHRAVLARIGAPETNGNLYLLHFAGEKGGGDVLRADPGTPVKAILSAEAIKANPFLKNMTAEELVGWAARKMGEEPHAGPTLRRDQFAEDAAGDAEWREAQAAVDAETAAEARAAGDARAPAAGELYDIGDPRTWDMEEAIGDNAIPGDAAPPERSPAMAAWHDAVQRLSAAQEGEAPAALYHPDVGPIDVKWGAAGSGRSDGYGLAKIARFHPEVVDDLPALMAAMDVTERGENRVILQSADHKAVVRLDWDGKRQTWLLSAYEKGKRGGGETPSASDYRRDADNGRDGSPDLGADDDIGDAPASGNASAPRPSRLLDGSPHFLMERIWENERRRGERPRALWMMRSLGGAQPRGYIKGWSPNSADVDRMIAESGGRWEKVLAVPDDGVIPAPGVTGFDHPGDVAAERQADSLEHDIRMLLDTPAGKDMTVQLDAEGKPVKAVDALGDADADMAAIERARACLKPPAGGGA